LRKNLICAKIKRRKKGKMEFSISRARIATIITMALLMASVTLMAMPFQSVQAQTPSELNIPHGGSPGRNVQGMPNLGPLPSGVTPQYTITQTAYMSITPNPVGVGQPVLVNVWTSPGMYHTFYGQGYTVQIQKPDGTTVTVGPFDSYLGDDTAWFQYVVDQVGTWKFKFSTEGTYLPAGNYTDRPGSGTTTRYILGASVWYTPCNTDWQEITVQQEMVSSWPPAPLPTDYWTEPVSSMNREWFSILGCYPWTGVIYYPNGRVQYPSNYRYTPYVQAPSTAHVVWRRQGAIGGIIGGDAGYYSFATGGGTPTIIYQGRCYQTVTKAPQPVYINGTWQYPPGNVSISAVTYWQCYDLRTGQLYWERPLATGESAPTDVLLEPPAASAAAASPGAEAQFGYTISLVSITNPSGTNPGRIVKYSPWTGAITTNVTGQPTGFTIGRPGIVSPSGEYGSILFNNTYVYSFQTLSAAAGLYSLIKWNAAGTSDNFTTRIISNVTAPNRYLPTALSATDYDAGVSATVEWAAIPGPQWCIGINITAFDMNTGARLWDYSTNDSVTNNIQTLSSPIADWGKLACAMQNRHWSCWDLRSGKKLWDSDLTAYPWGNWWAYATASYDFNGTFGEIIGCSYAGLYAIDWNTGHILWFFSDPSVPFEEPYGVYPFFTGVRMADGKIYAYSGEHTPSQPIARGWSLYCINATNGQLIWKIEGPMSPGPVADGYLTASNTYDGYMYIFGKGKSATTVSASPAVISKGSAVLIQGTVMDMSPGDQGSFLNPTARLDSPTAPGKVPCVSAASMRTQMEYLYEQQPIDGIWHNETITGVSVILTAIGTDGTVIDIGTTTTNGYYGTFSYAWTPPKEDTYTITATFAGDGSYGSSSAATAASVGPAPASPTPTPTPQPQAAPDNTPTIIGMGVAIIIAIAVVGIMLYRKHP
jgi:hypothetical protein